MTKVSTVLALLALSLVLASPPAVAQRAAGATISGIVLDSAGAPLPGASIAVRNAADSSLVTGAIAERDGHFTVLGVAPGRYLVRVSFVGYVTRWINDIEVAAADAEKPLNTITLKPEPTAGEGVTVTGRREFATQAIDRTIYKTSDLKVAAGGNVSDLLSNIPSIEVDADGNVSLRGSQNVAVQVNGRPTMMTGAALAAFLRSLPADAIERVEVIPNPSAKYDPEGLSGIINIVLKQNTDRGLSGGVNGSIGTDPNGTLGLFVGYGSGPWNLYANYGVNYEEMRGDNFRFRRSMVPGPPPLLNQEGYDTTYTLAHTLNASVEYVLGGSHSITWSGMVNRRDFPGDGRTDFLESGLGGELMRHYDRVSHSAIDALGTDQRLSYKWAPEPMKQELYVEARYGGDPNKSTDDYLMRDIATDSSAVPGSEIRTRTIQDNDYTILSLQADYVTPLGESGKVEAGFKGEMERIDNDFSSLSFDGTVGGFVPNGNLSNTFTYDRNINAGYLTYSHEFGRIGAQAGLRAEQVKTDFTLRTTNESFSNDYFSLFPSAFLTYAPVDELQFKASYSRRITRPHPQQLNPFPQFEDPTFKMVGNPNLKPEYIDSYDFSATYYYDQGMVTLNPYYRRQHDLIGRWERFDTNGASTLTFENFNTTDNVGVDAVVSYRIGDWLNAFVSGNVYEFQLDGSNVEQDLSQQSFVWALRGNVTATVMEGLDVQLTYMYRSPIQIVGGQIDAFQMDDIAIVKKIFDNRGTIGLRATDFLKLMDFRVNRTYGGFYQTYDRTWNSRTLSLTFSYSFGNPVRPPRRQGQQGGGGESVSPVGM